MTVSVQVGEDNKELRKQKKPMRRVVQTAGNLQPQITPFVHNQYTHQGGAITNDINILLQRKDI